MSTTDTAAFLLGLPHDVQQQLAVIARDADAMTDADKAYALVLFAKVGLHFGLGNGDDAYVPGAQMLTSLGLLLRRHHDHHCTATEGV